MLSYCFLYLLFSLILSPQMVSDTINGNLQVVPTVKTLPTEMNSAHRYRCEPSKIYIYIYFMQFRRTNSKMFTISTFYNQFLSDIQKNIFQSDVLYTEKISNIFLNKETYFVEGFYCMQTITNFLMVRQNKIQAVNRWFTQLNRNDINLFIQWSPHFESYYDQDPPLNTIISVTQLEFPGTIQLWR